MKQMTVIQTRSGAEITKIGGIQALILSSEMQLKYLISHYEHHAETVMSVKITC